MTSLRIGLTRLSGKLSNYAKRYGALEVQGDELPAASVLRKWRRQVPPSFAFSVVLPKALCELTSGKTSDDALARTVAAANALQASALLLATPPSVRPTKANVERIVELAKRLPQEGHVLAWEPTGLWSAEEAADVAAAGGWLLVVDAAEYEMPDEPVVYTRLRALGKATRLGQGRLVRLAERLAGRREAFVFADPVLGSRLASGLAAAVEQVGEVAAVPQLFKPGLALDLDGLDEEQ